RTDRHEALARPSRRLADRRRVGRVVLVAPDIRLHMRRRQQSNLMPEFDQRPPPMVSRGARLHRHQTPRQFGEESHQPAARELARDDSLALRVDSVNLKRVLRQIEPGAIQRCAGYGKDSAKEGSPTMATTKLSDE